MGFCHFFIQSRQKHTFFFAPFTSDFDDTMSIIAKTTQFSVIKKITSQLSMYFFRHTWGEHPTKQLVWVFRAYSWVELLLHFHENYGNIIKIWPSSIHKSIMSGLWRKLELGSGPLGSQGHAEPRIFKKMFGSLSLTWR